MKYDQDLSTQDTTGKVGKNMVHGFFMDIFFLYINRGLVLYYFCSFALFQEMRTSSTSTLVRASYRWPMQGLGLSFGSKDVDNMIDTIVCEGCKVFFFSKHPSLVSTVFGGRIPTARSSSCALWPWVSECFFLFWPYVVPKQLALKIFCPNWRQLPT